MLTRVPTWVWVSLVVASFVVLAGALAAMGRIPLCECGYVKIWHGVVLSSENSQHIADWYTFSHVIHGVLFYAVLTYFFPRTPLLYRLMLAVWAEAAWEIFENTNYIINRYRETTIAFDYFGDSIVNSLADTAAMVLGFFAAWRAPLALILSVVLLMELSVGYLIRDNLTLNVLMLVYPHSAILEWQSGAR